jgi:tRNA wybutosine-synthesizing protein 1
MNSSGSSQRTLVTAIVSLTVVAAASVVWYPYWQTKTKDTTSTSTSTTEEEFPDAPVREIGTQLSSPDPEELQRDRILAPNSITIVHGSVTGTCAKLAQELYETLQKLDNNNRTIQLGTLDEWDWWDELLNDEDEEEGNSSSSSKKKKKIAGVEPAPPVLLLLLPTHHGGAWPTTATCLETALQEMSHDWRIASHPLKKLQVAVMGMGCSDYGDDSMGKPAKEAFQSFRKLGAQVYGKQVRVGDDATGNQDRVLQAWIHHDILPKLIVGDDDDEEDNDAGDDKEPEITDMEDMGDSMEKTPVEEDNDGEEKKASEPREMVTATQAKALKKEGYKIIGTHSAVKLCRWTKHQLRGRGGCYKHTFYGITSYQCMETTPSLACANKCVFCWRHHKNPVGKEWKWKTDDPNFIVEEAVKMHIQMIKETKGIPGVNVERWKEAHTVRHCALSLVGEPIMYPRINELLADLHHRHISTYLVTNGQHPQAIRTLIPVTQLYVSVDAPTPESLIEIDRPLFSDAWERLKESLTLLKDKGQRTVARLTVVKGWNSDEIAGYAKLIALGKVSLVEVKGVTFCGKSDASNLNMSNTPWHHEVVEIVRTLKNELDKLRELGGEDAPPEYDFASEHKHSLCVLLARVDQFTETREDGSRLWKTWIDYPKFHELSEKHEKDPSFNYVVQDYTAETPAWALFGSEEEGFDPIDLRYRKKQKHPKYTKYDERGIPTHDDNDEELSSEEKARLTALMAEKMKQVGSGTTVTELKGGERRIEDASLMFRGLTVVK